MQDPSLPSHVGFGNLNGDGFGIGWFPPEEQRERDPTPCVFTSITPAWNNENLTRLSQKITSPLIFGHVRAAYPGEQPAVARPKGVWDHDIDSCMKTCCQLLKCFAGTCTLFVIMLLQG